MGLIFRKVEKNKIQISLFFSNLFSRPYILVRNEQNEQMWVRMQYNATGLYIIKAESFEASVVGRVIKDTLWLSFTLEYIYMYVKVGI